MDIRVLSPLEGVGSSISSSTSNKGSNKNKNKRNDTADVFLPEASTAILAQKAVLLTGVTTSTKTSAKTQVSCHKQNVHHYHGVMIVGSPCGRDARLVCVGSVSTITTTTTATESEILSPSSVAVVDDVAVNHNGVHLAWKGANLNRIIGKALAHIGDTSSSGDGFGGGGEEDDDSDANADDNKNTHNNGTTQIAQQQVKGGGVNADDDEEQQQSFRICMAGTDIALPAASKRKRKEMALAVAQMRRKRAMSTGAGGGKRSRAASHAPSSCAAAIAADENKTKKTSSFRNITWALATTTVPDEEDPTNSNKKMSVSGGGGGNGKRKPIIFIIRYIAGDDHCTVMGVDLKAALMMTTGPSSSATSAAGKSVVVFNGILSCRQCPLSAPKMASTDGNAAEAANGRKKTSSSDASSELFTISDVPSVNGVYHIAAAVAEDDTYAAADDEEDLADADDYEEEEDFATGCPEGGDDDDYLSTSTGDKKTSSQLQQNKKKRETAFTSAFVVAVAIGTTTIVKEQMAQAISAQQAASKALASLGLGGGAAKKDDDNGGGGIAFGSRKQRERQQAEAEAAKRKGESEVIECFELALVTGVCYIKTVSPATLLLTAEKEDGMGQRRRKVNPFTASTAIVVTPAATPLSRLVVPVAALGGRQLNNGYDVSNIATAERCLAGACSSSSGSGNGGGGSSSSKGNGLSSRRIGAYNLSRAILNNKHRSSLPLLATPQWAVSVTVPSHVGASHTLWSFDVVAAVADLPKDAGMIVRGGGGGGGATSLTSKGLAAPGVVGRVAVTYNRQSHINANKHYGSFYRSNSPTVSQKKRKDEEGNNNNSNSKGSPASPAPAPPHPIDATERVPHTCSYDRLSYMHEQNAPHYYGQFPPPASLMNGGNSSASMSNNTNCISYFTSPISTANSIGNFSTTMTSEMVNYVTLYGEDVATININRRRRREEKLLASSSQQQDAAVGSSSSPISAFGGRRIVFSPDKLITAEPLKAVIAIPLRPFTVSASSASLEHNSVLPITPQTPPPSLLLLVFPSCLILVDPRFSSGRCVIATLRCPLPTVNGAFTENAWCDSLPEKEGAFLLQSLLTMGSGGGKGTAPVAAIVGSGGANTANNATAGNSHLAAAQRKSARSATAWERLTSEVGALATTISTAVDQQPQSLSNTYSSGAGNNKASALTTKSAIQTNTTMIVGSVVAGVVSSDASSAVSPFAASPFAATQASGINGDATTVISFVIAVDPSDEIGGAVSVSRFEVTDVCFNALQQQRKTAKGEDEEEVDQKDGDKKGSGEKKDGGDAISNKSKIQNNTFAIETLFTTVTHAPTTPALSRALDHHIQQKAMANNANNKSSNGHCTVTATHANNSAAHLQQQQHLSLSLSKIDRNAEPTTALIAAATSDGFVRLSDLTTMSMMTKKKKSGNEAASDGAHEGIVIGRFDELLALTGGSKNKKNSKKNLLRGRGGVALTQLYVLVDPFDILSPSTVGAVSPHHQSAHQHQLVAATIICCLGFSNGLVKIFETKLFDCLSPLSSDHQTTMNTITNNAMCTHPVLKYERFLHNGPVTAFFAVNQIEKHWQYAALHTASSSSTNANGLATGVLNLSALLPPTSSSLVSPNSRNNNGNTFGSPTTTATPASRSGGITPFSNPSSPTSRMSSTGNGNGNGTASSSTSVGPSFLESLDFQIVSVSGSAGTICLHRKGDYHRYAMLHGSSSSSASSSGSDPLTGIFFDSESEYALVTTASGKGYLWQAITGMLERIYRSPADFINTLDVGSNLLALAASSSMAGGNENDNSDGIMGLAPSSSAAGGGGPAMVDVALSLLPISVYNDPLTNRNVLSLSSMRFIDMLKREVVRNTNATTTSSGSNTANASSPSSSAAAIVVGYSPTVIRGVHTLLKGLANLHKLAYGNRINNNGDKNRSGGSSSEAAVSASARSFSAAEISFRREVSSLGDHFGLQVEFAEDDTAEEAKHIASAKTTTKAGIAAQATEVLFAVMVLKSLVSTAPFSSSSSSSSDVFNASVDNASMTAAAATTPTTTTSLPAIAGRILNTITTNLPWAVPRGCHDDENVDSCDDTTTTTCYTVQSAIVIAIMREMVPILVACTNYASAGGGGGPAAAFGGGASAALMAAGAEAVIASGLAHVSHGPWCRYCINKNLNTNTSTTSSPKNGKGIFDIFAAMLSDPTMCKPPIVFAVTPPPPSHPASSSPVAGGGAGVVTTAPPSSVVGSVGRGGLNISPPPQPISTAAAAAQQQYNNSGSGTVCPSASSSAPLKESYIDQGAYLFLLSAIVSTLTPTHPQSSSSSLSEKQKQTRADMIRGLEAKLPSYLKMAVDIPTANFAGGGGSNNTNSNDGNNSPTAADGGSATNSSASSASSSSSSNTLVLPTVLCLVAKQWLHIRPSLKNGVSGGDALLKHILVYGCLRDVTNAMVRSACLSTLASCFDRQIRGEGTATATVSLKNEPASALWDMLKLWFNTAAGPAFHPDFVWKESSASSSSAPNTAITSPSSPALTTTAAAGGGGVTQQQQQHAQSAALAAAIINSKDATYTHRHMLINVFSRMVQLFPADMYVSDAFQKMLALVWIAIDPHSPSRAEREACFGAVSTLFRVAVKYLPNVSFQQKFQRIVIGHSSSGSGNVTVFDVKSTDEITKFVAFDTKSCRGGSIGGKATSSSLFLASPTGGLPSASAYYLPPYAVAAVAYSNLHHDIAVLPLDLSCVRIYHAAGASTFFLPSSYSNFKLKREVPLVRSASSASSSTANLCGVNNQSSTLLLTPQQVVSQCSLVWLSPQCVEVSSPWHDKVQATL